MNATKLKIIQKTSSMITSEDNIKNCPKRLSNELKLIQERNNFQTYSQRLEVKIKHNEDQFNQKYKALNYQCIRLKNKICELETEIKVKDELLRQKNTLFIQKTMENETLQNEILKLKQQLKSQPRSMSRAQSCYVKSETSVGSSVSSCSTSATEPEPLQNQYQHHGSQPNNKNRSQSMPNNKFIKDRLSSPPLKKHKITKAIPLKPLPPNIPKSVSNSSISDLRIRVNSFEDEKENENEIENDEYGLPLRPPFIHRKSSTQVSTLSEQAVNEPFPICDTPPINPALSPICEQESRDAYELNANRRMIECSLANSDSKDKLSLNLSLSDDNILIHNEWNQSVANSDEDDNISFGTFQSNDTKIIHNLLDTDYEELSPAKYDNFNSSSNSNFNQSEDKGDNPRMNMTDLESVTSQDTELLLQDSFNHSKHMFDLNQSQKFSFSQWELEQSRYLMDGINSTQLVPNASITIEDKMRLQHVLSLNEDLGYQDNYSPDSGDDEVDNKQSEEVSIMTDNNYLLMDINNPNNNNNVINKSGHFSKISKISIGNTSTYDVVVKSPISFRIVLNQDKSENDNDDKNASNTDCDDEKASMISSLKQEK